MIPKKKPDNGVRKASIKDAGKVYYFRRLPPDEARALEDEKRAELRRTGRVTGARTVRLLPGALSHQGDADVWRADSEDCALETDAQKLMVALIENARAALTSPALGSKRTDVRLDAQRDRREAIAWFRSDDRSYAFSFASICDVFEVAPARMRRKILGE